VSYPANRQTNKYGSIHYPCQPVAEVIMPIEIRHCENPVKLLCFRTDTRQADVSHTENDNLVTAQFSETVAEIHDNALTSNAMDTTASN